MSNQLARNFAGNSDTTPTPTTGFRYNCVVCGGAFLPKRNTRLYCGDRCRKAFSRATRNTRFGDDLVLRDQLVARRFVGQVWPVYRWDDAPKVIGLLVPASVAAADLGVTEADLSRLRRFFRIVDFKDDIVDRKIGEFRASGKHRRVLRDEALIRTHSDGETE